MRTPVRTVNNLNTNNALVSIDWSKIIERQFTIIVSIIIKILNKCPCDSSSNILMRTMTYFYEDKDEDIVIGHSQRP